jgi:NAD(P)-dependent dehydrogenase (short-subunit alcohol dehydrogenase family)
MSKEWLMTETGETPKASRRALLALGIAASTAAAACAPAAPVLPPAATGRRFEGRRVLITGATSGIGRASAEAFAAEGAHVVFCGRRADRGAEVQAAIRGAGGRADYIRADVRDQAQVAAFTRAAVQRMGGLDIAFNNAGVTVSRPLHEIALADWDNVIDTNVRGVFLAMQAQIPVMLEQGRGTILVTSSANAAGSRPNLGCYNASKKALLGLVETAALEYGPRGIRVNAICPGVVDTAMIRRQAGMESAPDPVWNAGLGVWANQNVHAFHRPASAAEMARAVLALASDDMGYMTGAAVYVDGGMAAAL